MIRLSQTLCKIFILLIFLSSEGSSNDKLSGTAKVIDGDTIYINNFKIRFSGIDAPESHYKGKSQICNSIETDEEIFCGNISKKALKDKIKNQLVICIPENKDRYNRIIAECFIEQESISSYMVKNGYAFDYVKYSKGKYQSDQNYAKDKKLGLWAMKFEYPWSWRKMNK